MTTSASLHATITVHAMRSSHQRPLVKPDVRNYRIRLTDDPSAIGIRKELTALISQVDKPLGLLCLIQRRSTKLPTVPLAPRPQKATPLLLGLTAQFPAQLRNFQGHTGFRFEPFFRRGTIVQAEFPLLLKTRSKSCPLAPRGLAVSWLLWAGPTPGQNRSAGYVFPASFGHGLPVALPFLPGLPGSPTVLWIHAASNHPGRPDATLLLSLGAGGRLPHLLGGSPSVSKSNEAESSSLTLRPASRLGHKTLTGSLDTLGHPSCRAVTSW
jgi:hypothetical protein